MNAAWYVGEDLYNSFDGQQTYNHGKLLQAEEFYQLNLNVFAV